MTLFKGTSDFCGLKYSVIIVILFNVDEMLYYKVDHLLVVES